MEYGCIGNPLKHSFSALIHPFFADYKYELCELSPEELDAFFKKKDFKAINVTIPYKTQVMKYLDFIDPLAAKIGAVNTIVNENGRLLGFNTDFFGLSALIKKSGLDLRDKKVLILGTGGTSKTALAVAESMGVGCALRVSRGNSGDISYNEAYELHNDAEIIINTTPAGMYPNIDGMALDIGKFPNLQGAVDAVYNPLRTCLIKSAKDKGIKAEGGLYMLISQAAKACEHFIGRVDYENIDRAYKAIMSDRQNIVLIGMPSSGKSTVGKELARELSKIFIDTDKEIEKKINMSIPEYFERFGEVEFRKTEQTVIKEISAVSGAVIATGGGAVLNRENIDYLSLNGRIYFLDRPLKKLMATSNRPLSSNTEALERRYAERYEIYKASSDIRIDADGTVKQNASKIKEDFLK